LSGENRLLRALTPIEKKPLFHVLPGSKAYAIATVGLQPQVFLLPDSDISQYLAAETGGTNYRQGNAALK